MPLVWLNVAFLGYPWASPCGRTRGALGRQPQRQTGAVAGVSLQHEGVLVQDRGPPWRRGMQVALKQALREP
jgi:hypothetical protein